MANTIFDKGEYKIQTLVEMADSGSLRLPDLQRGFVWKASKVRDLLDSMIKGYPIGFIMLWDSQSIPIDDRAIGTNNKTNRQTSVIIDGQQRITALYAVITGKEIIGADGKKPIRIAFNPVKREFTVANAATKRDPEWINNISEIYANSSKNRKFVNDYIEKYNSYLQKNGKELTEEDEQQISDSISDVLEIQNYNINALIIRSNIDEEDVADVFTRVNSGGVALNENDFILTLMSVISPKLRDDVEKFCDESKVPSKERSSYNNLIELEPRHIIRTTMAVAFKIARLKYAYKKLRGNELKKGADRTVNKDLQKQSFEELAEGLEKVLNLDNWHGFIKAVNTAGFISKEMISSDNALVYSYMIYLIGKYDFNVEYDKLRKIVACWYYMVSTTSLYTGPFEAKVQEELNAFASLKNSNEFEGYLNKQINITFTNDYFNITLPNELETSSATAAVWYTYLAALNILGAKALFSNLSIKDLLSGIFDGKRKAVEKHHIFPKAYLEKVGIKDNKDRNQIANFAYIEWEDNMEISDDAPIEYFKPIFEKKVPIEDRKNVMHIHALPQDWYEMDYKEFLEKRRTIMAQVIKEGFEKLMK